jgi:hypothetical protein
MVIEILSYLGGKSKNAGERNGCIGVGEVES